MPVSQSYRGILHTELSTVRLHLHGLDDGIISELESRYIGPIVVVNKFGMCIY